MSKSAKKWLLWGSIIVLICSLILVILSVFSEGRESDIYGFISTPILIISGLNLITLFSLRYSEKKWLRIIARFSIYSLLLPIVAYILLYDYFTTYPIGTLFKNLLEVLFISLISLSCLFGLIYVFLIKDAGEIRWVMGLLLLIVISLALERFVFNNHRIEEFLFVAFMVITLLTGFGMYMFGIRCLLQVEKNSYLKVISYLACLLIAFGSVVFMAIISSEEVRALELVYFIPAIILTLITLLSLPVSGYINWTPLHKSILKKIIISWIFFFMIFSIRYVFPEYFKIIEPKEEEAPYQFDMRDYELQNKNGLEPE